MEVGSQSPRVSAADRPANSLTPALSHGERVKEAVRPTGKRLSPWVRACFQLTETGQGRMVAAVELEGHASVEAAGEPEIRAGHGCEPTRAQSPLRTSGTQTGYVTPSPTAERFAAKA